MRIQFVFPIVLLWAALVEGCAGRPTPVISLNSTSGQGTPFAAQSVTVIERGWHTDIALAADSNTETIAQLRPAFPGARFFVFGFGDHTYYMSPNTNVLGMLGALFPGKGVILVTALSVSLAEAFEPQNVITLNLSPQQFEQIGAYIRRALTPDPKGSIQRLGDGPYPGSAFYASDEIYDAFDDCNHWTLAGLQAAGFPVEPDGAFFSGQVMDQTRWLAANQNNPKPATSPPAQSR